MSKISEELTRGRFQLKPFDMNSVKKAKITEGGAKKLYVRRKTESILEEINLNKNSFD